ncbi:MAG: hypothetical protein N3F09_04315 [Bacteroidia bacterium]|nr:hypothetical protein [Bacteroidia bacterium]
MKEDIISFKDEILPLNKELRSKIKFETVPEDYFYCKLKKCHTKIYPSYVITKINNKKDSFLLKDISKQKNIQLEKSNMKENMILEYKNDNFSDDYANAIGNLQDEIVKNYFNDSIQISGINFAFYYNNYFSINDATLNKSLLFKINAENKLEKIYWTNFNYFSDNLFRRCNCFDTIQDDEANKYSNYRKSYLDKIQIYNTYINDSAYFVMLKYPYKTIISRNDTIQIMHESKCYIYSKNFKNKTNRFYCLLEDGIVIPIQGKFIQDFLFPFHINENGLTTKVYNEENPFDNRFMAYYKFEECHNLRFDKLIEINHSSINNIDKSKNYLKNNSQFYFYLNHFIFWDYINNKVYNIPHKKIKLKNDNNIFIDDCYLHGVFLYVIFKQGDIRFLIKYDIVKNKVLFKKTFKFDEINNKNNFILFKGKYEELLLLNKKYFSVIKTEEALH